MCKSISYNSSLLGLLTCPYTYLPVTHLPEQDSMCALYFRQDTETLKYRHNKTLIYMFQCIIITSCIYFYSICCLTLRNSAFAFLPCDVESVVSLTLCLFIALRWKNCMKSWELQTVLPSVCEPRPEINKDM